MTQLVTDDDGDGECALILQMEVDLLGLDSTKSSSLRQSF